jgi:hypothetical protein
MHETCIKLGKYLSITIAPVRNREGSQEAINKKNCFVGVQRNPVIIIIIISLLMSHCVGTSVPYVYT